MISKLFQPLAFITATFTVDGKKYEVARFKVGFSQPTDHKGQPQHEMKGGQLALTLAQAPNANLYDWAKRSTKLKDGEIAFESNIGSAILKIAFTNAYCIALTREVDAVKGTTTTLVIAPEQVSLNGIVHDNNWER